MTEIANKIKDIIDSNAVVVFMKGTSKLPMCGFSGVVVQIFGRLGVNFYDVNVLDDEAIRQGIKDYSNWPTIPQVYIKGEFIGGSDIMRELYTSGELLKILQEKGVEFTAALS